MKSSLGNRLFRSRLISAAAASLIGVSVLSPMRADDMGSPDMSDEEFFRRVTGQYGLLPDREPPLTEGEFALLERLAPMIQNSPQMVISALTNVLVDGLPLSATFDQMLAGVYVAAEEWTQAEEAYRRAINKFPSFQRAWNGLGSMHMRLGLHAEAIKSLSQSIELGASDAQTFGLLGYALLQEGKFIAAETAYDTALLREPDNIRWLEGKVRIIAESGRHAEAIAAVSELQKQNPTNPEYWRLQANAYLALEDLSGTARSLEIARLLGPSNADALYLLGSVYMRQDLPTLAFDAYLAAMELEPAASPGLILAVARTLLARHRYALAERLMEAAAERIVSWPAVNLVDRHLVLGQLAVQRGDLVAARGEYEKLLEFKPLHPEALFRIARVLIDLKESERAEYYLVKVRGDVAYEYAAQLYLARLRIEAEHYEEALAPLREAMRLRPGSEAENLFNRVRAAIKAESRI